MSQAPLLDRKALLDTLMGDKVSKLSQISEAKQQQLSGSSSIITPLENLVTPQPVNALENYTDLDSYRAAGNPLTTEAARHFSRKGLKDSLAEFDKVKVADTARAELKGSLGDVVGGATIDSDLVRAGVAGALESVGSAAGFVGDVVSQGGRALEKGYVAAGGELSPLDQAVESVTPNLGNAFQSLEDWLHEGGAVLDQQQDDFSRRALEESAPTGDWDKPSTWDLGTDPSVKGYALHLAKIAGQLTTQGPMAATQAPMVAGAVMGGAQAGGSQARETEEFLGKLSDKELSESSGMYRDLIADGVDPATARQSTIMAASGASAAGGAVLGAAGGAVTSYILGPLQKVLEGNIASRLAQSVLIDTPLEGVQEVTETVTSRAAANAAIDGTRDVNEDTFGDLALGALGGASTGGVGAVAGAVESNRDEYATKQATKQKDVAAYDAAVEAGDPAVFLDKSKPTYSPTKAIDVLTAHSQREGVSEEAKQATIQKANDIVATLIEDAANKRADYANRTPEGLAALEAQLESQKTKQQTLAADPTKADQLAKTVERIDLLTSSLEEYQITSAKDLKDLQLQADEAEAILARAEEKQTALTSLVQTKPDALVDIIERADSTPEIDDTPAVEVTQKAIEKVLTLAMNSPDAVTPVMAMQLADNTQNTLSEPQRQFLRRFADSRADENAAKDLGDVTRLVMSGNLKDKNAKVRYKGLSDYQTIFRTALSNDVPKALKELNGLQEFATAHADKATAAEAAYAAVSGTGKSIFLSPVDGAWIEVPAMSAQERTQSGSLEIHGGSSKIVEGIRAEAQALKSGVAAMQASYDLKTGVQTAPVRTQVSTKQSPAARQATAEPSAQTQQQEAIPETTNEIVEVVSEATVEADTAAQTDDTPAENGVLSVIANDVTLADDVYESGQVVARFFRQISGREDSNSLRPLVEVQDFLSRLSKTRTDRVKITDFLDGVQLTDHQKGAISGFVAFARGLDPLFATVLPKLKIGQDKHLYKHPIHQFITMVDGKPVIDENLRTAISLAAHTWITEEGNAPANTDDAINKMLGRPKGSHVGPEAEQYLRHAGTRDNLTINSLGQKVVAALGLELVEDAPLNELARLEAALGAVALGLLVETGYAEHHEIPASVLSDLKTSDLDTLEQGAEDLIEDGESQDFTGARHFFVRINQTDPKMVETTHNVLTSARGSQGVLSKLFGVWDALKEPSLEPVPFLQKFAKRTKMLIPQELIKALQRAGKQPHYLKEDVWNVFSQLGDDIHEDIAGIVDTATVVQHKVQADRQQTVNEDLRKQLDRIRSFGEGLLELSDGSLPKFYFGFSVWKPQRVGIDSNTVNPQNSKIHRHMIAMEGWNTKVKLSDKSMVNSFKLRVVEGLDVSTDKISNDSALQDFESLRADPTIKAAVTALRKAKSDADLDTQGKMPGADQVAIRDAVRLGKKNFHSLDALIALAAYEQALETEAESFDIDLMGEIDGVTNGPMLSLLMMGASNFAGLNRGGFFEQGNAHVDHNLWRVAGNKDLYEGTVQSMFDRLKTLSQDPAIATTLRAVYRLAGKTLNGTDYSLEPVGRKIIKTPLTSMMFGAGIDNAVNNMADEAIDNFYTQVTAMYNGTAQTGLVSLLESMNVMLKAGGYRGQPLDTRMGLDTAKDLVLNKTQLKALKLAFRDTVGVAVKETLNENFATFLHRRNAFNKAAQTSFTLYRAAYDALKQQKIADLVAKGEITTRVVGGKEVPIHSLTAVQEKELQTQLKHLLPIMDTAMSQKGDGAAAGLYLAKSGRVPASEANAAYGVEADFGKGLKRTVTEQTNKTEFKSVRAEGLERIETDPGVAAMILAIHSSDSAIASRAYSQLVALNIHDALGVGIGEMQNTAQTLNQQTFNTLLDYSAPQAVYATLERSILGALDLLQADSTTATVKAAVLEHVREWVLKGNTVVEVLTATKEMAHNADSIKLDQMSKMNVVNQYSLEGGSYPVTDADRQKAVDTLQSLVRDIDPKTMAAAQALDTLLNAQPVPVKSTDKRKPAAQEATSLDRVSQDTNQTAEVREEAGKLLEAILDKQVSATAAVEQANTDIAAQVLEQVAQQPRKGWHRFGELGNPSIESNAALVNAFASKPVMRAAEVIALLEREMGGQRQTNIQAFQLRLLAQLKHHINPRLSVYYVTADTDLRRNFDTDITKARGWYQGKTSSQEIFVKSPEFVHSGLTTDMLLHELTHAALAAVVDAALNNPNHAARVLVDELDALRKQAAAHINKDVSLAGKYRSAVTDVHELIAWGMTNAGFQKDVLSQLMVEGGSKTTGNKFVSGMLKFIETMTGILFRKSSKTAQEQAATGLAILISNTSGLLAAAQEVDAGKSITLKQQDTTALTGVELFEAIGNTSNARLSPVFATKLRGLLSDIVSQVRDPFEIFNNEQAQDPAVSPVDRYIQTLAGGARPFVSDVLTAGFKMVPQVSFVLEQVEAVIGSTLRNTSTTVDTSAVEKTLRRIHGEARRILTAEHFYKAMTGRDWATALPHERLIAEQQRNFVFDEVVDADGVNHSISRFTAMALTMPEIEQMLQFESYRTEKQWKDLNWSQRLHEGFAMALALVSDLFTGKVSVSRSGDRAAVQVRDLVNALVQIETRRQTKLARQDNSQMAKLNAAVAAFKDGATNKVVATLNSPMVRRRGGNIVKAMGSVAAVVAGDKADRLLDLIRDYGSKMQQGQPNIAMGVLSEVRSLDDRIMDSILVAGNNEKDRKEIKDGTTQTLRDEFAEGVLTPAVEAMISQVMLRTDMAALLPHFTLSQLEAMLAQPAVLTAAIKTLEDSLNKNTHVNFYLRQAKDLGLFLSTGLVRNANLLLNAGNIARHWGTTTSIAEAAAKAVLPTIDQLVSLYALTHVNEATRREASELMRSEAARNGRNGVELTLQMHQRLQEESRTRLFHDSEGLMTKGYTPEMYDEGIEIGVADAQAGAALEKSGWKKGGQVTLDHADPDQRTQHLYVLADRGLLRRVSGSISFTGTRMKGSRQHGSITDPVSGTVHSSNAKVHADIMAKKQRQIAALYQTPRNYTPDVSKRENHMVPVFNADGGVVNHRYMMNNHTKDTVLNRDNSFAVMLGALAGNIADKQSSVVQNKKVFEILHQQFTEEYALRPDSYLEVGPNSSDPELRELWTMLSSTAHRDVKDIWGREGMMVRSDLLHPVFGYRKRSIANALNKSQEDRDAAGRFEKAYVKFVEAIFKQLNQEGLAGLRVRQLEDMWQEIVTETKDILVVKTGVTLYWNVISNTTLLWWMGVSPADIARHSRIALTGAIDYRRDHKELQHLTRMRDSGYIKGDVKELNQSIIRLQSQIASNPTRELIEAGLLPTIVEDVAADNDPYSYKTKLQKRTEKYTQQVPAQVRKVARTIYMAHDTPLYQVLSQGTQLSDFMARYALYQHMTTRKTDPLSKADAVRKASDVFVNYDVPSHPGMQYLNDTGLVYFTKYYLRIQRTILEQWKEDPARGLMLMAANGYFDSFQMILDSTVRVGNPFEWGILKYAEAFDEGMLMNMAGSVAGGVIPGE